MRPTCYSLVMTPPEWILKIPKVGDAESKLSEWFKTNDLKVNVNETSKILFTHKSTQYVNSIKVGHLEVNLDSVLT